MAFNSSKGRETRALLRRSMVYKYIKADLIDARSLLRERTRARGGFIIYAGGKRRLIECEKFLCERERERAVID